MPVIVFLLDNSASMNQMTHLGTSLFDVAKSAIEQFLKFRQRDASAARSDRYMLLTLDEPPNNVKVGWKETMNVFTNYLKTLEATGLTQMGPAIKQAFDLLNLSRHAVDHDTYGWGRFPHLLDPSLIIVLTDKQKLTSNAGVQNEINIPMNTGPYGSELTKEPFRWDQRLFSIVLAIPANASSINQITPSINSGTGNNPDAPTNQFIPPAIDQPITPMCDVTGGRSYYITTQRALFQCLDSLVQKIQAGVVVNLEKVMNEGDTERCPWHSCRKMIMIPRSMPKPEYNWPIPEDYWPTAAMTSLPPRSAHALIKFQTTPCTIVNDKFPFDKYELEPSPLTQYILERRQSTTAWPVFVQGSTRAGPAHLGAPFGYLKASTSLTTVNLYVMPYNYPKLSSLLDELSKTHGTTVSKSWQNQFDDYLRSIPPYYLPPLKRVLARRQLLFVFEAFEKQNPIQQTAFLSPQIGSYLKRIRTQAKTELDQWAPLQEKPSPSIHLLPIRSDILIDKNSLSNNEFHELGDDFLQNNFVMRPKSMINLSMVSYLNLLETPRHQLMDVVTKLRRHFLQSDPQRPTLLHDEDALHSVPIKEMSNYDTYPRSSGQPAPLRDIDAQPVRQHMFGNPFKVNRVRDQSYIPIDEIDEFVGSAAVPQQSNQTRKRTSADPTPANPMKKKRTPLVLRNYVYRRNSSFSSNSVPSSPASSTTSNDEGSDAESTSVVNRFSFDIQSVFDDDRRRVLKKHRDTKKKFKALFRRQADQEIQSLLESYTSNDELELTLLNELVFECRRLYPSFESRLVEYKINRIQRSTDDQPSTSSMLIDD